MKGCETVRLDAVEPVHGASDVEIGPSRRGLLREVHEPGAVVGGVTLSGRHNQRHLAARSPPLLSHQHVVSTDTAGSAFD